MVVCFPSTVQVHLSKATVWSFLVCVLQKMLQSPYFFFDVVYLHNGAEDHGEDTSWRVSGNSHRADSWYWQSTKLTDGHSPDSHVFSSPWMTDNINSCLSLYVPVYGAVCLSPRSSANLNTISILKYKIPVVEIQMKFIHVFDRFDQAFQWLLYATYRWLLQHVQHSKQK